MDYIGEKINRKSYRYREYDYTQSGSYVITVVVENRECSLGTVRDQEFWPSEAGNVVQACWSRLPVRFPTIELDAFVVMPNHIRGIVFLGANPHEFEDRPPTPVATPPPSVTSQFLALKGSGRPPVPPSRDRVRPALGEIVRSLKASSSTQVRKQVNPVFAWQPNYWDRIIRNDAELERYRTYIENNPARWEEDKEYLKGDW